MAHFGRTFAASKVARDYEMAPTSMYLLILLAMGLQLATFFVPYFTSGGTKAVLVQTEPSTSAEPTIGCFGKEDSCVTNQALLGTSVALAFTTLVFMGIADSKYSMTPVKFILGKFKSFVEFFSSLVGLNVTTCIMLGLTMVFSISSFTFQMVDGDLVKREESGTIEYDMGFYFSVISMVIYIIVFGFMCGFFGKNIGSIISNCLKGPN